MDTFTYNNITILTPRVDVLESEAVYDEADKSVMYTRTLIRVNGFIQPQPQPQQDQSLPVLTFSQNYAAQRKALLVPRRYLKIHWSNAVAGDDMWSITSYEQASGASNSDIVSADKDDNDGPKPRRCVVNEIMGGSFAQVVFEIEVCKQEKCTNHSNVISNTYSVTHAIDSNFLTTRTLRGKVRVANVTLGTANANNPDTDLRALIVPQLPTNFRRESMSFSITVDRLVMEYEIVDKEVYRLAPTNCTDVSGRFSQQADKYVWHNHFNIEVKGAPNVSHLDLYNAAFLVASTRINFATEFLEQAIIEEELYENIVRLSITTQVQQLAGQAVSLFPANTPIFTGVPIAAAAPDLGPFGYAIIAAGITPCYDPCLNATSIPPIRYSAATGTSQDNGGGGDDSGGGQVFSGGTPNKTSQNNTNFAYKVWEQEASYHQINGLDVVPNAYAGHAGNIYQWHNPYMVITITGHAVRVGAKVQIATPLIWQNGAVRNQEIRHFAPDIMPDKQTFIYSASWSWEIVVPFSDPVTSGSLGELTIGSDGLVSVPFGGPGGKYQIPTNFALEFDAIGIGQQYTDVDIVPQPGLLQESQDPPP